MEFFEKIEQKPKNDLTWNIPEQKRGFVSIVGGNSQNFRAEIKIAEIMGKEYPIETLNLVLPDALRTKLPDLPNFVFLKSTDSGSFLDENELSLIFNSSEYNLLLGDLSKNSITGVAVASACENSEKPLLITRDAIDLVADNNPEKILMKENIILLASMAQLIKIFRAVYYPKMLLLSQSLIQVTDALHKFTLSYPVSIITLHNEQILIAKNGSIKAIPLDKTGYKPINIWQGELAAKIVALNLYNPQNFIDATITALMR